MHTNYIANTNYKSTAKLCSLDLLQMKPQLSKSIQGAHVQRFIKVFWNQDCRNPRGVAEVIIDYRLKT